MTERDGERGRYVAAFPDAHLVAWDGTIARIV